MVDDTGPLGAEGKHGRRFRGFRRAGALIAPQTAAASARRGFLEARLKTLWPEAVGPEIASVARPLKLSAARGPAGGLLTLGVMGANGPQVQMLLPVIRERVNATLGPGCVGRIQITHAPAAFAEAAAPARPPEPAPVDLGSMAEPLSSIGDPDLRGALETLARNVLSRSRKSALKGN